MMLLVMGLGYVGGYVAELFRKRGWEVAGTCRRRGEAEYYENLGVKVLEFDALADSVSEEVKETARLATHVLWTIPPTDGAVAEKGFIELLGPQTVWAGYLSTTGVYGDSDGAWVNEDSGTNATSARARKRDVAEQVWLQSRVPSVVFRLPGIYGPGRGLLARMREGRGKRVRRDGQVFSRCHVTDIGAAIEASIFHPTGRSLAVASALGAFDVVDGSPAPPEDVTAWAARVSGAEVPRLQTWEEASKDMSRMALSFYSESKRLSGGRARAVLGWKPEFPSYREGLLDQARVEYARGMSRTIGSELVAKVGEVWDFLWEGGADSRGGERKGPKTVVLVDNGSVMEASREAMQNLAERVRQRCAWEHMECNVIASSARHAPEETLFGTVLKNLPESENEVCVIPLFFGPSRTVTSYLPTQNPRPDSLRMDIKPSLVSKDSVPSGAEHVAAAIRDAVLQTLQSQNTESFGKIQVLLVEHGSPSKAVSQVREQVADVLRDYLPATGAAHGLDFSGGVTTCAMERREGSAYDHCEPMLESVLPAIDATTVQTTIIAPMFLFPGRHAGPEGDLETIIAEHCPPDHRCLFSSPIGDTDIIADLVFSRLSNDK